MQLLLVEVLVAVLDVLAEAVLEELLVEVELAVDAVVSESPPPQADTSDTAPPASIQPRIRRRSRN
jgi:hypothetical protein